MTSALVKAQQTGISKKSVMIDLDTGNEVDDLYALARILLDTTLTVSAINSTHWQTSHWAIPNTMENSHRLNQQLLAILDMKVKTNRGGVERMYDWGDRAQHSAAAYDIIRRVKLLEKDQKLTILALGALTNVASAIFIDVTIAEKIDLYWLGSTYDFESEKFGITDFNSVMDSFALQYILSSTLEMHILPLNVAKDMMVKYSKLKIEFNNKKLGSYLIKRWENHLDPLVNERCLWDVALVEAFLYPEWTEQVSLKLSKDYGQRSVKFYKSIDANQMIVDFKSIILNHE